MLLHGSKWKSFLIYILKGVLLRIDYRGTIVEAGIPMKKLFQFRYKMMVAWSKVVVVKEVRSDKILEIF